jgi:type IV pilus assembly protein PilC
MAAQAQKVEKIHVFNWTGTDPKGKKIRGESRSSSVGMVRAELRRKGIRPLKVRKQSTELFARKKKIIPGDIAMVTRQLSTMLNAGVPLVQGLDIIGRGQNNPSLQQLLLTVKGDIEGGSSLSGALGRHPYHFDSLFCNLVHAGEQAGILESILDKIATYKEKTETLKGKIKKAMFYPVAVVVVAIIVTAVLLIFVIPQFENLFSSFGAELPAFTRMVIDLSQFVREYWWIILGFAAAFFIVVKNLWKRSTRFKELVDRTVLKLPILGNIINQAAIARFARTLGTMFSAGVPLVEALESVAGATGNIVYGNAVMNMREGVTAGQSLQLTMEQEKLFPHIVIQMVAIGEESGALDTMLGKVADFYEEQVDNAVDALSSLLEPLIMVILGVLVGGLVIAMYLPIFKLGAAI